MKRQSYFLPSALLSLIIAGAAIYFLWIRELVELAYSNTAPAWFHHLVDIFYPRFTVEKQRFDLSFFLSKADQVVLRSSLAGIFAVLLHIAVLKNKKIKTALHAFWDTSVTRTNAAVLRIFFYLFMLLIFKDIYWDLLSWGKAEVFYRPILFHKILHLPFPTSAGIFLIYLVLIISCTACIFNIYPVLFSIVAILNFILIQGYIFGFEKTDHGFATFTYAGMIMPFLIYYSRKEREKLVVEGWPLQLIVTVIAMCYLFSGLEKLFISGIDWAAPETFRAYLLIHPTATGMRVSQSDFLCSLLPFMALLFQLGFISAVYYKKLRWFFLPAGIAFHVTTYILFDVGGYTNPWILTYIYFVNWDSIIKQKNKVPAGA